MVAAHVIDHSSLPRSAWERVLDAPRPGTDTRLVVCPVAEFARIPLCGPVRRLLAKAATGRGRRAAKRRSHAERGKEGIKRPRSGPEAFPRGAWEGGGLCKP